MTAYNDWPRDVVIKNNIVYSNFAELEYGSTNIIPQVTYENNYTADPLFANPSLADHESLTLPDLSLSAGSPCIQAGTHITRANGAGASSTLLAVDDAYSFQDGTWGSDLLGRTGRLDRHRHDHQCRPDRGGRLRNAGHHACLADDLGGRCPDMALPEIRWSARPLRLGPRYRGASVDRVRRSSSRSGPVERGPGTRLIDAYAFARGRLLRSSCPLPRSRSRADALDLTAGELSPWDIRLGPLDNESLLPVLNWPAGSQPEMPIGQTAYIDKMTLSDGSARYNFRVYSPRKWTLEWARLSAAEVTGIQTLAAYNEPLHYQNRWVGTDWHWVIITACDPTPITHTPYFKLTLELEEVL